MGRESDATDDADSFRQEVERLRAAGVAGHSGRLRELFDHLAERGPNAGSATQAEIALDVFRQAEPDAEDATVRVYIHRLRKKLEDHYRANPPSPGTPMLEIPSGIYALQIAGTQQGQNGAEQASTLLATPPASAGVRAVPRSWLALAVLALIAAFVGGLMLNRASAPAPNALWQPLIESDRPVLLVLGDYYLFGEIDPVRPEEGRLIRDFRVNSPEDLLRMQEADPARFGMAEDVGLNYLPFQTAFALEQVTPLLAAAQKDVRVIAASELTSAMLSSHDVVYLGLLSGMGLLEEITFAGSTLRIGESYDQIIDRETGQSWTSDEARRLASPAFYRDYAYVARLRAPGGALVMVVASERITGLRGVGAIVAAQDIPRDLSGPAAAPAFEALFQVTGQQGADLSDRLILARARQ